MRFNQAPVRRQIRRLCAQPFDAPEPFAAATAYLVENLTLIQGSPSVPVGVPSWRRAPA